MAATASATDMRRCADIFALRLMRIIVSIGRRRVEQLLYGLFEKRFWLMVHHCWLLAARTAAIFVSIDCLRVHGSASLRSRYRM